MKTIFFKYSKRKNKVDAASKVPIHQSNCAGFMVRQDHHESSYVTFGLPKSLHALLALTCQMSTSVRHSL